MVIKIHNIQTYKRFFQKQVQFVMGFAIFFFFSLNIQAEKKQNKISVGEKQELIFLETAENLFKDNLVKSAYLYYNDFLELYPDSAHEILVLEKIAQIQEKLYEFKTAAFTYKKLQRKTEDHEKLAEYMKKEATMFEEMGFYKEALEVYHKILNSQVNAELARVVSNKVELLNQKLAGRN